MFLSRATSDASGPPGVQISFCPSTSTDSAKPNWAGFGPNLLQQVDRLEHLALGRIEGDQLGEAGHEEHPVAVDGRRAARARPTAGPRLSNSGPYAVFHFGEPSGLKAKR